MEDNQKLQAILECHCQSIARVASNTELHASLKDYGYDTKMLQKGIELAEEVYALLYSFQEEPLQPYDLANSYWVISEQAQRRYCAIVKQLNSTASLNLELMKVIPPVVDTLAQSESLHTAYNLYRHLLINTERYADLLSFAGISVIMLEEELGILGTLSQEVCKLKNHSLKLNLKPILKGKDELVQNNPPVRNLARPLSGCFHKR